MSYPLILQRVAAARARVTEFARCVPMKNSAGWPTRGVAAFYTKNNKFLIGKRILAATGNSISPPLWPGPIFLSVLFAAIRRRFFQLVPRCQRSKIQRLVRDPQVQVCQNATRISNETVCFGSRAVKIVSSRITGNRYFQRRLKYLPKSESRWLRRDYFRTILDRIFNCMRIDGTSF